MLGGPYEVHRQGRWITQLINILSDYASVVGSVYYVHVLITSFCVFSLSVPNFMSNGYTLLSYEHVEIDAAL